jgi:beta-glucosidase
VLSVYSLLLLSIEEYYFKNNIYSLLTMKYIAGRILVKTIKKKVIPSVLLFAAVASSAPAQKPIYHEGWVDFNKNGKMDTYENPSESIDNRIEDLLRQMTVEEKTAQMATLYGSGRVLKDAMPTPEWKNEIWKDGIGNIDEEHNGLGSFGAKYAFPFSKHVETIHTLQRWFVEETRLGIPVDFTNEGIRGLCHYQATLFPAQSGQGATWNKELIGKIAEITGVEARALGYTNIYSPILDIARDPRWGRVVECYGEDPYLVSQLGKRMIQGLQKNHVVSTPKHFAVYSVPVGGRDEDTRTDPHVAPREMRTLFLEPFRVAFQEAGALGVMSSYNDYDGIPITGNYHFLSEILRHEWGFRGYVVSDSDAVEFLYNKHNVASDAVDAAALAVNAGLNVRTNFTLPQEFILPLREAVKQGKVSMQTIDSRVRDILRVKFILGLFDNPYTGDAKNVDKIVATPEHKAVSLDAARQSLVLLKNQDNALPLSKNLKKIALIGPNADERRYFICRYGPANPPIITVKEGLQKLLPNAEIIYERGCDIIDKNFPESEIIPEPLDAEEQGMIDKAVAAARQSDVAIVVLGGSEKTVRESFSRSNLDMPGRQLDLLKAVYATGKPVVLVMIDGRAVSINWANKYIPAIMQASFPGEFTGTAIAEALFGDYNPGGKLTVTYPKSVGQIPFAFPFKRGSDTSGPVRVSGALYPFGYGLSYTTFEYSGLQITPEKAGKLSNVEVSFNVTNTGKVAGDEVVQLYIRDEVSSIATYVQVLRGFERVPLKPGETKTLKFTLTPQDLGLWDRHDEFVVEPGFFEVRVGASSQDIRLKGRFEIVE